MKITVSVPGKIHLMGEHSVVYGKPALLSAINLRMYATIEEAPKLVIKTSESDTLIHHSIEVFQKAYHMEELRPFALTMISSIPAGFHLGSSAATAVATLGALHLFFNKGWNVTKINELAYEVEKKQHGNPSGGDNTAVTFGGFLWYRREFEFLKSMWQLPFKIATTLKPFILVSSGKPSETTGEMVSLVSSKLKVQRSKFEKIFTDQEQVTKNVTLALKEGDEKALIENIRLGERNLEAMGVVGKKSTSMIRIIEANGGAAKILGGGGVKEGSGMLLVYHPEPKVLSELVSKKKWEMTRITLGEEGLQKEP